MGRFTLRLPESLHQELEALASREGVSLNQYIIYALTRQTGVAYKIEVLPERIVQDQSADYKASLAKLGQPNVEDAKAFLNEREDVYSEPGLSREMIERIREKFGS